MAQIAMPSSSQVPVVSVSGSRLAATSSSRSRPVSAAAQASEVLGFPSTAQFMGKSRAPAAARGPAGPPAAQPSPPAAAAAAPATTPARVPAASAQSPAPAGAADAAGDQAPVVPLDALAWAMATGLTDATAAAAMARLTRALFSVRATVPQATLSLDRRDAASGTWPA